MDDLCRNVNHLPRPGGKHFLSFGHSLLPFDQRFFRLLVLANVDQVCDKKNSIERKIPLEIWGQTYRRRT